MAVYQFSALSDGQAISFNPGADVLNFDQTAIAAADIRTHTEGGNLRLVYVESGKDVVLLNTTPLQLTTSNITFADGSRLLFGDNTTGQSADSSGNSLLGTAGADHLWGLGGADTLNGGAGDDWLVGGTGQDNMTGGTGADRHVFVDTPFNTNYDRVFGFVSGTDEIWLRDEAFASIGASGGFAAGDARFYAAAGASGGHDADDRIIYNTSNGNLFYDADGSGASKAMFVGVLHGAPTLVASDIVVFGGEDTPPPSNTPTDGNDTLVGTAGNDTIDGLAGDDFISGLAGDDSLVGSAGADTLDGGTGDDTFRVDADDTLVDAGGIDTVIAPGDWTLGSGLENLILTGPPAPGSGGTMFGTGNELNNVITSQVGFSFLNGLRGNDTLIGSDGPDFFIFYPNHGSDTADGGLGEDWLNFQALETGATIDFHAGTATSAFGAIGFVNIESAIGSRADDHLVADDQGRDLRGEDGDDTLIGGAGNDALNGGGDFFDQFGGSGGNDLLVGGGGDDRLIGEDGMDTLHGGAGNDTLEGDGETGTPNLADVFVFDQPAGAANADIVLDFDYQGVADELHLDNSAMPNLGLAGRFTAGDPRFFAASGANSGQDPSDRVVYNTTTGQLWYDADGNGSGAALLIATLGGTPSLDATDIVVIGAGPAPIVGTEGDDTLVGTNGNDTIIGFGGADTLNGAGGDDWLEGGTGQDALTGGPGADSFAFRDTPFNNNADRMFNFASGTDELVFDNDAYTNIGAPGDFAAGDGRFYAAAGAVRGHDADDRIIYNTSNGTLYYDADGSGTGREMFIGVLHGAPMLDATDIAII